MKWVTLILVATLAVPIVTIAQRTVPLLPGRAGRGPVALPPLIPPSNAEEEKAALKFIQEYSPTRYNFFQRLPETDPRHNNQLQRMVQLWRNLQRLQQNNPDAYQARLRQIRLEDQALGFASENSEAKLQEAVGNFVDQTLAERQRRIANLKLLLDEQEKLLAEDQKNRDQLVQNQITQAKARAQQLNRLLRNGAASPNQGDPITAPSSR